VPWTSWYMSVGIAVIPESTHRTESALSWAGTF
jgi:hypothetical protein